MKLVGSMPVSATSVKKSARYVRIKETFYTRYTVVDGRAGRPPSPDLALTSEFLLLLHEIPALFRTTICVFRRRDVILSHNVVHIPAAPSISYFLRLLENFSPVMSARHTYAGARTAVAVARTVRTYAAAPEANGTTAGDVPEPKILIDNQSDPFATVVSLEYGDLLGDLADTTAALKSHNLNIRRAKIRTKNGMAVHKFYITDARTSEKVVKSARIEEIRLEILNCLMQYHPESSSRLATGNMAMVDMDYEHPLGKAARNIVTQVSIRESETGMYTKLFVNTVDRPGLLTDIVKVLKDINLNVVSAEVDTVGRNAVDIFNITYHGEPLPEAMCQLAVNTLQYYLSKGDVEKEWSESY